MTKSTLFLGGYAYERIDRRTARKDFDEYHNDICITDDGYRYTLFQTTDGDARAWWDRISFDEEIEALEYRIGRKLRRPSFYNLNSPVVRGDFPTMEAVGSFRPDANGDPEFIAD